jgi:hypothetical protein
MYKHNQPSVLQWFIERVDCCVMISLRHHSSMLCYCRLPVAATPDQVYGSVDADTVLAVLTHKITHAVRAQVRTKHHNIIYSTLYTITPLRKQYAPNTHPLRSSEPHAVLCCADDPVCCVLSAGRVLVKLVCCCVTGW